MGKIYTEAGWVNWDYIMAQEESIISVVGARGTGKTYGLFKWLIEHKQKFIYLRRLKSQLEECRKDAGNPFKKLNTDLVMNIRPFPLAGSVAFNYDERYGETAAIGVALSVVANIRGVDYSDFDYIVFDRFVSLFALPFGFHSSEKKRGRRWGIFRELCPQRTSRRRNPRKLSACI